MPNSQRGGALNNYCSADKLPAKPTCRCNNLIQFSPPFHVRADGFAYVRGELMQIFFYVPFAYPERKHQAF